MGQRLIIDLLLLTGLFGQAIEKQIDFTARLGQDFKPHLLAVGKNDNIFMIDTRQRQLAVLRIDGTTAVTGGFGRTDDTFFDPVDIAVNDLEIVVCDRADNRLLRYDLNLNYIGDIQLPDYSAEMVYPDGLGIDPWGNYFLLSTYQGQLMKLDYLLNGINSFVDLELMAGARDCWSEMAIQASGAIALIDTCTRRISTFNRFGRAGGMVPLGMRGAAFCAGLADEWLLIDAVGNWQLLGQSGVIRNGRIDTGGNKIRQIATKQNKVYLLTATAIIIVRFA